MLMTASIVQLGRRTRMRFPVALPVEYALNGSSHRSTSRNLSSGGIFIDTDATMPVGQRIRLSIDWPVSLDGRCGLRLIIMGMVVRRETGGAAIRIIKYEFRVRPAASAAG
jgi:PilZ domain-containing protein